MTEQHADVIVIGSGIGGLTVASLMAQLAHKRVLVLERHFKLGGFTHSFSRPGNRSWDVGLHYVGEVENGSMARDIFDLITQQQVQWQKMDSPFEKFVYPDMTLEVPDEEEAYQAALMEMFPHEVDAIRTFFADVRTARKWLQVYTLIQLMPKRVGPLLRVVFRGKEKLALSLTGTYLKRRCRDPRLRAILASQWGNYGLPPSKSAFLIHATIVGHYLNGGYYPVGGASTIANSIASVIEKYGGRCLVNHTVTDILLKDGKAIGVKALAGSGTRAKEVVYYAPVIVSAAGAYTTLCKLLPPCVAGLLAKEVERLSQDSFSAVTVYLALKDSPKTVGLTAANHWLFSSMDHDDMYRRAEQILDGRPAYCFLSFPSLRNPQATSHTAEIIAPLPYHVVAQWRERPWKRRGEDYEALKRRVAETLLSFVEAYFPGFKSLVDAWEVSTPLTIETFTGHRFGAMYGLPATPERYCLSGLRVQTPVPNVYLTGADVISPGIVGAMMGGVTTAAHLMGINGFYRIMTAAKHLK